MLVIPGKEVSLEIVTANFQVLCEMNKDIHARQMYDQRKNNYIPCYLHSINILAQRTETTPKDYEFRLLMLETADDG